MFADEMASRAATRVEVLPGQANAVKAIDSMAWKVRMRIMEANLAAFSAQPQAGVLANSAHQATEKRDSRKGMSCLKS